MVTKADVIGWMLEDRGQILVDPDNNNIITGYVTFTPDRARSALENNTRNRKMGAKKQVPAIKESLLNGMWNANVSTISFAEDSTLSDGQNRLFAVTETGVPMRNLVTWGVEKDAQLVTDRRGTRTLTNDIEIAGFHQANHLAAITRIKYLREEKGLDIKTIINRGYVVSTAASDVVLFKYFMSHSDEIVEKMKTARRIYFAIRDLDVNMAVINTLSVEFNDINSVDAECFWSKLSTGVATSEWDPVVLLRKRLSENARSQTNKIPAIVMTALIIKAWNLFERGETTMSLKYRSGGASPEPFPKIYDPNKE